MLLIQLPAYSRASPPLGIATLKAYLKEKGYESTCVDYNIGFYNFARDKIAHNWEYLDEMVDWNDINPYNQRISPLFEVVESWQTLEKKRKTIAFVAKLLGQKEP